MKIVADENIPLVEHYFGSLGELVLKPGRAISRDDVSDATILLVRSITPVNQQLLKHSTIQFVGSATTGADHIDTIWLNQAGISWSIAYGCNRIAVVEYVIAVIAALQKMNYLIQDHVRAGVIGVGGIGSEVAKRLSMLGFDVVLCDPFRSLKERDFKGVFLEELRDLDFITLHTPLTYEGTYPTYHMIEKNFLKRQKKNTILLNTSRGSVIDFNDLKQYGEALIWCLDVWENEPAIDIDVLQKSLIATPHIAGYSVQSKYRGIEMLYHAAIEHGVIPSREIPPIDYPHITLSLPNEPSDWRDWVLAIYNPFLTTKLMKETLSQHRDKFDWLRKHFQERHELEFVKRNPISCP